MHIFSNDMCVLKKTELLEDDPFPGRPVFVQFNENMVKTNTLVIQDR